MKVTCMRKDGRKLTWGELDDVCNALIARFEFSGFITEVHQLGLTSIKIGLRMRSFRINTEMLGHNARLGYLNGLRQLMQCSHTDVGFKRTDVPTWEQREEFNHIVNAVFDKYDISANIKSGPYTIREGLVAVKHWDDFQGQQQSVVPLTEEMKAEAKRIRKEKRQKEKHLKKVEMSLGRVSDIYLSLVNGGAK